MAPLKIETYELATLYERLLILQKKNMDASGVRIKINYFGDPIQEIGCLDFQGEHLAALIPILLDSIKETLGFRRVMLKADLAIITRIIGEQP